MSSRLIPGGIGSLVKLVGTDTFLKSILITELLALSCSEWDDGFEISSWSTAAFVSFLAAPLGILAADAVGPGVSGPEAEPPPSGSTFSFPFSGFSPSLVINCLMRSLFFLLLTNSAKRLVELMLFSCARRSAAARGGVRRGGVCRVPPRPGDDRLWLLSPRLRPGLRLPLLERRRLDFCQQQMLSWDGKRREEGEGGRRKNNNNNNFMWFPIN